MKNDITIVIPVKDKIETVNWFIEGNDYILNKYKVIVIDTKGGGKLKQYSFVYIDDTEGKYTMSKARKLGLDLVKTKYILNLDTHVILPKYYINASLLLMELNNEIGAISIEHKKLMGHLGFGQSIWRTDLLKELYNYDVDNKYCCECFYMWSKLNETKYKLETMGNMRCKHLKENK